MRELNKRYKHISQLLHKCMRGRYFSGQILKNLLDVPISRFYYPSSIRNYSVLVNLKSSKSFGAVEENLTNNIEYQDF